MKTIASIVTLADEDILPRVLAHARDQFDYLVVSVSAKAWEGYPFEHDPTESLDIAEDIADLVLVSDCNTQVEQRNEAIKNASNEGILSPGDIHAILDSDEFWPSTEEIFAQFQNLDIDAMAGRFLDFYFDGSHVRSSGRFNNSQHLYCYKDRFVRWQPGSAFLGNNYMVYGNGRPYPSLKGKDRPPMAPVACYHYDYTRPADRCYLKYEAFKHRHPGVRKDWYKRVYLPCMARGATYCNGDEHGVGLIGTPGYYNCTVKITADHPFQMKGYPYL